MVMKRWILNSVIFDCWYICYLYLYSKQLFAVCTIALSVDFDQIPCLLPTNQWTQLSKNSISSTIHWFMQCFWINESLFVLIHFFFFWFFILIRVSEGTISMSECQNSMFYWNFFDWIELNIKWRSDRRHDNSRSYADCPVAH